MTIEELQAAYRRHPWVTVVVYGEAAAVEINPDQPLTSVMHSALMMTNNLAGQPVECWEIRDGRGELLDPDASIGSLGFELDTRLFLNLRAGIGGSGDITDQPPLLPRMGLDDAARLIRVVLTDTLRAHQRGVNGPVFERCSCGTSYVDLLGRDEHLVDAVTTALVAVFTEHAHLQQVRQQALARGDDWTATHPELAGEDGVTR